MMLFRVLWTSVVLVTVSVRAEDCSSDKILSLAENSDYLTCSADTSFDSTSTTMTAAQTAAFCSNSACMGFLNALKSMDLGNCTLPGTTMTMQDLLGNLDTTCSNSTAAAATSGSSIPFTGSASTSTTDTTPTASSSTSAPLDSVPTTKSSGAGSATTGGKTSTSSGISTTQLAGIAVGVLAVLGAVIGFVFYRRHRKKDAQDKPGADDPSSSDYRAENTGLDEQQTYGGSTASGMSMGVPTISTRHRSTKESAATSLWNESDLLSWRLQPEQIEDVRQLGSGAYATVWLVRFRNSQWLASKRVRPELRSKERTAEFVQEIKLVANFDHPNLVSFVGVTWTTESDLQALLEFMDGGDLRDHLTNPNTPHSWTPDKFGIAVDIIEALVYLHSFSPPVVHRDLKSRNVLLSSQLQAKVSDFGTSRLRSEENTMTACVGTGRWLAPEVIIGDGNYGPAADIYSFGVLLTELDTHEIPYSRAVGTNGNALSNMAILHQVATAKLRPTVGAFCPPELRELVDRCVVHDPCARPAAAVIAYELRKMGNRVVRY